MMTVRVKENIANFRRSFPADVKLTFIPWNTPQLIQRLKEYAPTAIIISGSEQRILTSKVQLPKDILKLNIPILGLCYGFEWLMITLKGCNAICTFDNDQSHTYSRYLDPFKTSIGKHRYYFTHHDHIVAIPDDWEIDIKGNSFNHEQIWMAHSKKQKIMALQFHPEHYNASAKPFYSAWLAWLQR